MALSAIAELFLFNLSSLRSIGYSPITITDNISIDASDGYVTDAFKVDAKVHNVYIEDMDLINVEYADVYVSLTDEGDQYEYDLPVERVVPGVKGSGYINIYPYGKVGEIRVHISLPEGGAGRIDRIGINGHKPFVLRPVRIMALWFVLSLLICVFMSGFYIETERNNKKQLICIAALFVLLTVFGRWMSVSNPLMVSCPWPHHKQYQELAVSLSQGTVKLKEMEVSPLLLAKDNPYDTSALIKENIPYGMDYAYYKGSYYVYFGIVPELLLYFPYYAITGRSLANYNADLILYTLFVAGVLLCIRELIFRFAPDEKRPGYSKVPFVIYVLMCIGTCLFPNMVYLISRPDIYNIPIMAASAFTFMGLGLWLKADTINGYIRTACIALGSLSMALVAGCRPQMLLFSLTGIFLFVLRTGGNGKLSFKERTVFKKDRIADTLAICLPYLAVAIVVCAYNYLRFNNIFDFGATYSLTSNDMNHRGFNLDRLIRGLYCFLLQPAVMKTDFPYMESALIESSYMGRNMTEYTYGGVFATELVLLSLFAPLFAKLRGFTGEIKALVITFVMGALIIAGFDVNGAGILYRYSCDMIPGLLLAAMILWIVLMRDDDKSSMIQKLYAAAFVAGLAYAFLVFTGTEGSVNLKDNAVVLYERIRQGFLW